MTTELLEIMQKDIKRCEDAQSSNEGTHRLYQALIAKYNGIFEGFEKDIPTSGKAAFGGGEFNYRPELNAIKEKLELLIVTDNDKDPLFNFKVMYEDDLESLKKAISDAENRETPESAKLQLYKDVTAKYHPYIPKLSDGLYDYIQAYAFYDDVSGESLFHNLKQVYNKMLSFKALGYPSLKETVPQSVPMVQITNTNENKVDGEKCTLCKERTDRGDEPMCVKCCLAKARIFGDLDDPESEVSRVVRERNATALLPEQGTRPQVRYFN